MEHVCDFVPAKPPPADVIGIGCSLVGSLIVVLAVAGLITAVAGPIGIFGTALWPAWVAYMAIKHTAEQSKRDVPRGEHGKPLVICYACRTTREMTEEDEFRFEYERKKEAERLRIENEERERKRAELRAARFEETKARLERDAEEHRKREEAERPIREERERQRRAAEAERERVAAEERERRRIEEEWMAKQREERRLAAEAKFRSQDVSSGVCPACGTTGLRGAAFCSKCGTQLTGGKT